MVSSRTKLICMKTSGNLKENLTIQGEIYRLRGESGINQFRGEICQFEQIYHLGSRPVLLI